MDLNSRVCVCVFQLWISKNAQMTIGWVVNGLTRMIAAHGFESRSHLFVNSQISVRHVNGSGLNFCFEV